MKEDFVWGVATSAYQIEGGKFADGKRASIWDEFCRKKGAILNNHRGDHACDFFYQYKNDLQLLKELQIDNFRFSISWPRVIPFGDGFINQKGLDFYDRLVDECLKNNINPWITLYHWDLPHALELKGGWTNRDILQWFNDYTEIIAKKLGDRVKNWMVLNEPVVFTGAGYYLGVHAPGRKGTSNYFPALHHTALCQAQGIRTLKELVINAQVGTTFSCSYISPANPESEKDIIASNKVDTLLNRLFVEPLLGYGYPFHDLPFLARLEKYMHPGDNKLLRECPDFIGIQNYTREVVKHHFLQPVLKARIIDAKSRNVERTIMNWEVYPEAIYEMIKKFNSYRHISKIYITENGAAFKDEVGPHGEINDKHRIHYLESYLEQIMRAKEEGMKVNGYFLWSLLDNFEWSEGYAPRFGIVHVNYKNQKRTIKNSGYWYRDFIQQYKEVEKQKQTQQSEESVF
ncbi:MAG: GH1 family beta-glucosidase [Bacteroidota bacterium]